MVEVLYEDNHILVVKKPQNILTQGDVTGDANLLDICKQYIKQKYDKQGNVFLGMVHRLDRPTGGVIVFARNSKAAGRLSEQIKDGRFQKEYLAIVEGSPREVSAHLMNYLKKDERNNKVTICTQLEKDAKKAELDYITLQSNQNISLLKIKLNTGRSHQIRIQLSNIGCPIVSDIKYGAKLRITNNLSLWAYMLSFEHPTKNERLTFYCFPEKDQKPWNAFNLSSL